MDGLVEVVKRVAEALYRQAAAMENATIQRGRMVEVLALPADPTKEPHLVAFRADAVTSLSYADAEYVGKRNGDGNVASLPQKRRTLIIALLGQHPIPSVESLEEVLAKVRGE